MTSPTTVFTVGDFIRRVVDSLLSGECRGQSLCARCLIKLTKDNLDRSYAKPEIVRVMDEIFAAPRRWVEGSYPTLGYFNKADRGGHFAAWEEPELFSTEMRAAFRSLR